MLHIMRKYKNSVLGLVIIGFCATLMVGFGVDMLNSEKNNQVVATLNGDEEITQRDYYRRQQQIAQMLRQQYGENFDAIKSALNIEQQAIDSLISERVLSGFVQNAGLSTSTDKIEEQIKSHPFFSGGFSKESYQRYLAAMGMTSSQLEETLREEMSRQQLLEILGELGRPSKKEIDSAFEQENAKAKFRYAEISPLAFNDEVKVDDEAKLQEFFEKNKEQYRVPTKVRYSFIALKPEAFEDKVSIAPEDLETAYREQRSSFEEPRQVRFRQIFLDISKAKQQNDAAKALLKGDKKDAKKEDLKPKDVKLLEAQDIERRLQDGEDFVSLAKSVSDDEATKANGGLVEWTSIKELDPEIKKGLNNVEAGQLSDIIETEKGFYLIKVEESKDARQKSLDEVKPELEATLRKADAPLFTSLEAENLVAEFQGKGGSVSFADFAKEKGLTLESSKEALDGGRDPEGAEPGLTARTLRIGEGQTQVVEIIDEDMLKVAYVVNVEKVEESHLPELAAVKEEVIKSFRLSESDRLAKEFADQVVTDLKAAPKATLAELDKNEKYEGKIKLAETPLLTKSDPWGGASVGLDIRTAAFNLTPEQPVALKSFHARDSYFIVELLEREALSGDDLKKKREDFEKSQAVRESNRMLFTLVEVLRADANVEVNNDALQLNASPM